MVGYGGKTNRGSFGGFPNPSRWPANLIHDGSDEVVDCFPLVARRPFRRISKRDFGGYGGGGSGAITYGPPVAAGSAARFFYCAKAGPSERGPGNKHPTVKPLALLRYLVKLTLPPGGVLLDPLMGSGTTGMAAVALGRKFVGIELKRKWFNLAVKRIEAAVADATPRSSTSLRSTRARARQRERASRN